MIAPAEAIMATHGGAAEKAPPVILLGHPTALDRSSKEFKDALPKYREEMKEWARNNCVKALFALTGHGSHNQIKNREQLKKDLKKLAGQLDSEWGGKGSWGVLYGGDPYNSQKPDVGAVAFELAELGVKVIAIICEDYAGGLSKPENYSFLSGAIVYKSEKKKDGSLIFGGRNPTNSLKHVAAATRYVFDIFGKADEKPGEQLLHGNLCCGGGPISLMEFEESLERGYPCYYLPVEAKKHVVDSELTHGESDVNKFGIMERFVKDVGLPPSVWVVMDMTTAPNFGGAAKAGGADGADAGAANGHVFGFDTPRDNVVGWVEAVKADRARMASQARADSAAPDHAPMWHLARKRDAKGKPTQEPITVVDEYGSERLVISRRQQRDVEIGFTIKQVFAISEHDNTVGFRFDLTAQVECAVGTPRERFVPPFFEFTNALEISFNGEDGWHSSKVNDAWKYVEQTDPCGPKRAFFRLTGECNGRFLAGMQLESFPFDTQVFEIVLTGGDVAEERFTPLRYPPAVVLPTAGLPTPSWSLLTYKEKGNGCEKGDPWCGVTFGTTGPEPITRINRRKITCTLGIHRIPNSVIINIGAPVFLLSLAALLLYTIPASGDDELKDERLAVAFIAFLTFITLKIVVMEMLPPLPNSTLIEEYIMWAIAFVGVVAGHNQILLAQNSVRGDDDEIKRVDRISMIFSCGLWVLLHLWLLWRWWTNLLETKRFLKDNALEIAERVRTSALESEGH